MWDTILQDETKIATSYHIWTVNFMKKYPGHKETIHPWCYTICNTVLATSSNCKAKQHLPFAWLKTNWREIKWEERKLGDFELFSGLDIERIWGGKKKWVWDQQNFLSIFGEKTREDV